MESRDTCSGISAASSNELVAKKANTIIKVIKICLALMVLTPFP
jgi:hypothetical protein